MQYPMRRKDRAMNEEYARELLTKGEYLVMATCGENGQPYATPLSYVFSNSENVIYFHCAHEGRKINNLTFNPRVCLVTVGQTRPVYDKNFTTYYESVMVFGTAVQVEDPKEKTDFLMRLAKKYLPDHMDKAPADIAKSLGRTAVYKVVIEQITGKMKKPKA